MISEAWLVLLIGSALAIVRVLSQAELWQRKEYRLDRMQSFLFSAEQRSVWSYPLLMALVTVNIGWLMYWLHAPFAARAAGWLTLLCLAVHDGIRIQQRGLFRPKSTVKGMTVVFVTVLLLLPVAWWLGLPPRAGALGWATLIILVPVVAALGVAIVNIPFALAKYIIIARAARLRDGLKKLTVVGITGSYGKTSTKFFLQQLVEGTQSVLVTAEHRNAPIAVAQDMLKRLSPTTELYIVEMGAYRAREIADLARLTKPMYGVITAISNQHVALFGSREKLAAAKWELIEALPSDGVAILNAASDVIRARAAKETRPIVWYLAHDPKDFPELTTTPVVYVTEVTVAPLEIHGRLHIAGAHFAVTLPLLSRAMLESVVAAVATAHALKVPSEQIVERLARLTAYERTMKRESGKQGSLIIDDSYSANEQGVREALLHLARFSGPKIVVLAPIIELGEEGEAVHERLGRLLPATKATVYVTSDLYQEALLRGAREVAPSFSCKVATTPQALLAELTAAVTADTVVLLEGRLPDVVRQGLLKPGE
ncbi:MAG: Mur ligase family protein [Candidatus Andersenbacteria bacterium]